MGLAMIWWQWLIAVPVVVGGVALLVLWCLGVLAFVAGIVHDEFISNRLYRHQHQEQRHWWRRKKALDNGASDSGPPFYGRGNAAQRHHEKVLRHREKARRWEAYQEAVEATRRARNALGQPVGVDWDEPTPEKRYAEIMERDPALAKALKEGTWPPGTRRGWPV